MLKIRRALAVMAAQAASPADLKLEPYLEIRTEIRKSSPGIQVCLSVLVGPSAHHLRVRFRRARRI